MNEQREVKQRLKEMDMPEIMDWFRQEGIELGKAEGLELGKAEGKAEGLAEGLAEGMAEGMRRKALEDARKMLDRGCDWEFITSITGIIPADLEA